MNKTLITCLMVSTTALSTQADTITHLSATLSQTGVVKGGVVGTPATGTGIASFVLTEPDVGESTLSYLITLLGADLDGNQTPAEPNDNVTAIHLHDTNVCVAAGCVAGDTVGTKHALNIFGLPRADDADMTSDAANEKVTGLWDASDKNAESPAPSGNPSEFLTQLFAGELFLMVHTPQVATGAYGGYITRVPEPTSLVLFCVGATSLMATRRRRID